MKLFKKLAAIYSGSGDEEPMRQYIKRWIRSSVHGVEIVEDEFGNLYVTKGVSETYPCVVAHLDQVQKPYPADYKVLESSDIIMGYSPSSRKRHGLGADDKCGIWIALKMLKKHEAIKVAFFPGEEVGCIGSSRANMEFFDDVRFVIEPDRRGAHDLITSIGFMDICSQEFIEAIQPEQFGYTAAQGMMTDVEVLKENGLSVSCINLSCGYYSPHTEDEYIVKKDLINACEFVDSIITNCVETYPHISKLDDWYGDSYYSGYSRAKKKEDIDFDKWDEEFSEAYEYLAAEMEADPNIKARDFLSSYSGCFKYLDVKDVEDLISDIKYEMSHSRYDYSDDYWKQQIDKDK